MGKDLGVVQPFIMVYLKMQIEDIHRRLAIVELRRYSRHHAWKRPIYVIATQKKSALERGVLVS